MQFPPHRSLFKPALLSLAASASLTHAAVILDQATLSMDFHNVSGTVTVVDADTLRVDGFTYDGQGIDVYFYLGTEDTRPAFTSGLEIGPQLFGTVFDGTEGPMTIDLPGGETMADYNAISVWCVDVSVSFGSGTFSAVPEPSTIGLSSLAALGLLRRRR